MKKRSRDISVGRATGLIPGSGKIFFVLHHVQTGFGTRPVSYKMGTEGCFPGGKAAMVES
jgi:hypothetical protein